MHEPGERKLGRPAGAATHRDQQTFSLLTWLWRKETRTSDRSPVEVWKRCARAEPRLVATAQGGTTPARTAHQHTDCLAPQPFFMTPHNAAPRSPGMLSGMQSDRCAKRCTAQKSGQRGKAGRPSHQAATRKNRAAWCAIIVLTLCL